MSCWSRWLATFSKNLDTTYLTPEEGLQFYLSIWGADYPDPQNFVSQQLRSDSPNNNGHWENAQFDELAKQATPTWATPRNACNCTTRPSKLPSTKSAGCRSTCLSSAC